MDDSCDSGSAPRRPTILAELSCALASTWSVPADPATRFGSTARLVQRVRWTYGELLVVLSQQEADDFMQAGKVVPDRGQPITWEPAHAWVRWRGSIEVRGVQVGEVFLVAHTEIAERWSFKIDYHGTTVYRLEARPHDNKHSNPREGRPSGFPAKVRARLHEHVYCEGLDTDCARAVRCKPPPLHHSDIMAIFCDHARLAFGPKYQHPPFVVPRLELP